MTALRLPPPPVLPRLPAYALGVGLPLIAFALELALRPWSERLPYVAYFLTAAASAWLGGAGPGLVSVLVSTVAAAALLRASPVPGHAAHAWLGTVPFLAVGAVTALLAALARGGFLERERSAAELRARADALERTEQLLREAVRARDEFISVASHELKTPLTSMQLRLQQLTRSLARGGGRDDEVSRALAVLDRQAYRLGALVNNVLDVSRIGAGRVELALQDVDLDVALREVIAHLEPQLEDSGARLTVAAGPLRGRWDRLRLEQVIGNLLSNALKYGEGRPIEVSLDLDGALARLDVRDHGTGIPADERVRVFQRFERGTHAGSGLGVGLWLVREMVAAHGGAVLLRSAPGQGSIFTVLLPLEPGGPGTLGVRAGTASLTPELRSGDRTLDLQHASIISESQRLVALPPDGVWASLATLTEYVGSHFAFEEEIMQAARYPDRGAHRREHDMFMRRFSRMRAAIQRDGPREQHVHALASTVETWVRGHVLGRDLGLARFVREHERGAAPGA